MDSIVVMKTFFFFLFCRSSRVLTLICSISLLHKLNSLAVVAKSVTDVHKFDNWRTNKID